MKTPKKDNKGARTRDSILAAARRVFSRHPYKAASMRMIGREAGIEHPLINYYFPNKAALFEAVIAWIIDDLSSKIVEWNESVRTMKLKVGLRWFIGRLIEYNRTTPETLRILSLNMTQPYDFEEIPGYGLIPGFIENIRLAFSRTMGLKGSEKEVSMLIDSFNFMVIAFLGASSCTARVLRKDPMSDDYAEWVTDTLTYVFAPRMRELLLGGASKEKR
jgi:TetR/AcrR family transcriptional regulator